MSKSSIISEELRHHLPLTLGVSLLAGILVAVFYNFGRVPGESFFEVLHPAHVLVSAVATSAIYYRYNKKWVNAVLVGTAGAILIGTFSDVLLPWLAGNVFLLHTHLHLPIIEKPVLILSLALIGSIIGMYKDFFKVSHSLHIFLSVFASLFYLLAYSIDLVLVEIVLVSLIVFVAVYVPCCISDIVFPILFIDKPCKSCGHYH